MIDRLLFALTLVTALGCGLMAGTFFAFSCFIMKALARLQPLQGIAAMQSINIAVLNPVFFLVFLGTGAGCALLAVFSLLRWYRVDAFYLLIGSLLYLGGTLVVTIVCNVPRNEALARVDSASPDAAKLWHAYLTGWTTWNHVRTLAALAAAASLTIALCLAR